MSFQSLGRSGLGRALAISIAFHVLLLWPAPVTWQEAGSAQRLIATLRAPQPAATPIPKTSPARSAVAPRPQEIVRPPDSPLSTAPVTALPPSDAQAAAPSLSTAAGAVRSGMAPEPTTATANQMSGEGLDAEGLRGYRLALARAARGHKRYPREAEAAGWQGTAEVRVTVLEGGVSQEPKLMRSSGHAALDDAALDMLRHAVPMTPVPPVLRQRAFTVDLPVVFELPE